MNITQAHIKDGRRVHIGTCDYTPTMWITKTKWDSKVVVKVVKGEVQYYDSKGDEMLIYEDDEEEWEYWYEREIDCYACQDTGRSYWSDGVYGDCMECDRVRIE